MKSEPQPTGIVVSCDELGNVLEVVRDDLGLGARFSSYRPLALAMDRGSLKKALRLVQTIRDQKVIADWQLAVSNGADFFVLSFAGVRGATGLLIAGSHNRHESVTLLQMYAERFGLDPHVFQGEFERDLNQLVSSQVQDDVLFDEFGRLNNELINLQRELAKKNAELERLNEEKNRFLGIAAHDLRNPLNAIQMYSEFLIDEVGNHLDSEHLEFITIIHDSSEFMLRLVNDLLDVAQIESGKLYLEMLPIDLVTVLEQNVAINRTLAARKNIELALVLNERSVPATADKAKLEQVLNNLIGNAVKFSQPHTRVSVSIATDKNEVVISVSDQGPGIPRDELKNLFTPFQRTSVRPTGDEKSTGLGLAIAQRIVRGHKGRIWVESEVGIGTTFYVSIPIDLVDR